MANVNPYNPEPVNQAVGTPGLDENAGRAPSALAAGANAVRNEVAQLSSISNPSMLGQIVSVGLRTAGAVIANYHADVAKQKSMLADLGVTNDGHKFGVMAGELYRQAQKDHVNDPENLEGDLRTRLDYDKKQRLAAYKDPILRGKAENLFDAEIESTMNKAGDKALSMQTDQAMALIPQTVTTARQAIAQHKGTLEERNDNFSNQWQLLQATVKRTEPQLGKAFVNAKLKEAHRELSDTYFQNQITERPDEPLPALKQLSNTKLLLQGSVEQGFDLTVDDKQKLTQRIEAAERSELRSYDLYLQHGLSGFISETEVMRNDLIQKYTDSETQQNALNWAKDTARQITEFMRADDADPLTSEEVKHLQRESYITQLRHVDQIVQTAHANQKYQEALRNAAEAERRRNAHEAQRLRNEAEHLKNERDRKIKEAARENLKMGEREAKVRVNSILTQMGNADPVKDKEKLVQWNRELNTFMAEAQNADYLDPDYVRARRNEADKIGDAASQLIMGEKKVGQFLWWPQTVQAVQQLTPTKNAAEIYAAQQDYRDKVAGVQQAQSDLKQSAELRSMGSDIPAAGKAEWDEWSTKIQSSQQSPESKKINLQILKARLMRGQ